MPLAIYPEELQSLSKRYWIPPCSRSINAPAVANWSHQVPN